MSYADKGLRSIQLFADLQTPEPWTAGGTTDARTDAAGEAASVELVGRHQHARHRKQPRPVRLLCFVFYSVRIDLKTPCWHWQLQISNGVLMSSYVPTVCRSTTCQEQKPQQSSATANMDLF